jgi:hypothetical protein
MNGSLAFWLSIALSAFGCTGFVLAGKGDRRGWVIVLVAQPLWCVFAVVTGGYGICLTCLLYTVVAIRNLVQQEDGASEGPGRERGRRRGPPSSSVAASAHSTTLEEPSCFSQSR